MGENSKTLHENIKRKKIKGVTFSNLPDKVPLVWGLPSSPMGSSWVYAEPDLNYTETAVTRNTVRKFTLANDGSYFNIDPSLLSQEEINNGLVWAASVSRVIKKRHRIFA